METIVKKEEQIVFINLFKYVQSRIHVMAVNSGFWPEMKADRNKGEAIALMHSELSEMLDVIRSGKAQSVDVNCVEFTMEETELADLIIRAMDYAEGFGLDLPGAIIAKIEHNATRPFKHGKTF